MPGQSPDTSPHVLLRPCDPNCTTEYKKYDTVLFTCWSKQYDTQGQPRFVIMPLSTLYERVFVAEDEPLMYRQDKLDSFDARMYRYEHEQKGQSELYPNVNDINDMCYVAHPVRLWPGEFTS